MTQEEILLKVGLDGSGFDQNLAKSTNSLEHFAEKGHASFVHVEKPARAFHHLLGEIGSRVPLVSEGLMALVNPTTGIIALVGAGFALAIEKLKEFNKTMDEVSAKNAKAIDLNKQGLAELGREQREFSKSLNIDPVTGITKAVGEEKDPSTRLSQARQNRDRFASERNARLDEIKRLREQERHLTGLPSRIKETEELIASLEAATPNIAGHPLLGVLPGGAFLARRHGLENVTEEALAGLRGSLGTMKAQLGTPERLKALSERRQQLEGEIKERDRAVRELQDIIDPMAPHDVLPRGRKGGSFTITGPAGSFSGTIGGDSQAIKEYLKAIAESPVIKDGKLRVPNGQ